MKSRYSPFELIDCLRRLKIHGRLGVGRVVMPDFGWYFDMATANLCAIQANTPDIVLASLSHHDEPAVVARYIASLQAALRKGLVA